MNGSCTFCCHVCIGNEGVCCKYTMYTKTFINDSIGNEGVREYNMFHLLRCRGPSAFCFCDL